MSDVELVVIFLSTLLIIITLWNPARMRTLENEIPLSVSQQKDLIQLIALLEVSANFEVAYEKWNPSGETLDVQLQQQLRQVSRLTHNHGLGAKDLVGNIEHHRAIQRALRAQWDEFSTPAKTTSKLLMVLPLLTHLIALSIGIGATTWMLSNPFGVGLLLLSLVLTVLSFWYQRRDPLKRIGTVSWSQERASVLMFVTVLIWQPSVQGIVIGFVLALFVGDFWATLLKNTYIKKVATRRFENTWELSIVIAALQTGMSWGSVLEILESELEESRRPELQEIRKRIEQGATPEEAFVRSEVWFDIGKSLTYAQNEGARVVPVLSALRDSTMREYKSEQEIRVRKQAQLLTVVVSALQLPAFIAVGLVPIAAEPITTLLQQFSSTVSIS